MQLSGCRHRVCIWLSRSLINKVVTPEVSEVRGKLWSPLKRGLYSLRVSVDYGTEFTPSICGDYISLSLNQLISITVDGFNLTRALTLDNK